MEFLLIGLAVAFNLIVIKIKFEKGRIQDGSFDTFLLVLVTVVFSGSYAGLVVGTIASCLVSLYLLISPPKFFSNNLGSFTDELKDRLGRG